MGTWNYRVGTYMFSYKKTFPDNEKFHQMEDERLYKIISVYYDKDGIINGYGERSDIDGFDDLKSLKFTLNKMKEATKKPILNLDSFPDIYIP